MTEFSLNYLNIIAQALYDKKGFNILVLDVRSISSITDYYVIAEGTADRHVLALAQNVTLTLKTHDLSPLHVEGDHSGDWVVIDYMGCMVHLFMPGVREKYRLEELWQQAQIVDVAIDVSPKVVHSFG